MVQNRRIILAAIRGIQVVHDGEEAARTSVRHRGIRHRNERTVGAGRKCIYDITRVLVVGKGAWKTKVYFDIVKYRQPVPSKFADRAKWIVATCSRPQNCLN